MRACEALTIRLRQSKYFLLVSFSVCVCESSGFERKLAAKNIYTWSNTPLGTIKIVILGQGRYIHILLTLRRLTVGNFIDPYINPGQAHGERFYLSSKMIF
jgi:uracil DNA glycosylase